MSLNELKKRHSALYEALKMVYNFTEKLSKEDPEYYNNLLLLNKLEMEIIKEKRIVFSEMCPLIDDEM